MRRDEIDAERADLTELHGDTAQRAAPEVGHCATHGDYTPWRDAVAVLAMPEMQAIRLALRSMSAVIARLHDYRDVSPGDVLEGHLNGADDPDSVSHIIRWVMDGEQ